MQEAVDRADPLMLASIPKSASEVHVVAIRLKRLMDNEIARTLAANGGLNVAEWRILFVLNRAGRLTQKDITHEIFMEQAQASRALSAMQDKGLVQTSRDPDDLRRWYFSLTPDGLDLFGQVNPAMQERRRRIDSILSGDELEIFRALATKVAKGMRQWEATGARD